MTNTEIIIDALKARGMTDGQLSQLLDAYKGDLHRHVRLRRVLSTANQTCRNL